MNKKIRSDLTDKLFRAILSMETIDECYLLFEDLCTVNEIQAIAQRMEVAAMLDAADSCRRRTCFFCNFHISTLRVKHGGNLHA